MARLREGIHLRGYANVNPLQEYVNEGYDMFRECLEMASVDAVLNLVNIDKFVNQVEAAQAAARKAEEERIAAEAAQNAQNDANHDVVGEAKKEEEK